MAAAISLPDDALVGDNVVLTGTGFANTTAFTATITQPDREVIVLKGTTSGAGALDIANEGVIQAKREGILSVSVSDGTSTVTDTCRVWRSA